MALDLILTLGPASRDPSILRPLLDHADAFRLNSSHLDAAALDTWLRELAALFQESGRTIPVVVDLQGSKMRLGEYPSRFVEEEELTLELGTRFSGDPSRVPIPEPLLFQHTQIGEELTLNDRKVSLEVLEVSAERIRGRVRRPGPLSRAKGVNRPGHPFPLGSLRPRDQEAIEVSRSFPFTHFAYSFVVSGAEAALLREHTDRPLVAKLERPDAFPHLEAIDAAFDSLWFCRGDLGAQAGLAALGPLQEEFARGIAGRSSPSVLAGQVLEHMTHFPQPTRSEVVHLHEVDRAGWSGIVLSDETAVGKHPCAVARLLGELGLAGNRTREPE